ncbi:MAG: superoxide dismutase family protein [Xanthobacteraceae bacterium]|uniref:superoxide dismutase family protein n=1 Tax=Pseudolabrys sp. TaxID=1960880 RepID=UPI003D0FB854
MTPTTKLSLTFAAMTLALVAVSPASAQTAKAALKDAKGADAGSATLTQTPTGVLIALSLKNIPAGEHAFHVHAVGKCEPPFTSAGGHFNPGNKKHGLMASDGHHAGDMPNLHVPSGGALNVEVLNASITLDKGKPNSVFDNDGSAVVVHAGKDDYKSDPTGDAGGRIACGVIE